MYIFIYCRIYCIYCIYRCTVPIRTLQINFEHIFVSLFFGYQGPSTCSTPCSCRSWGVEGQVVDVSCLSNWDLNDPPRLGYSIHYPVVWIVVTRWWQLKYFWNFHPYLLFFNFHTEKWENDPIWWFAYFSNGLVQPLTRNALKVGTKIMYFLIDITRVLWTQDAKRHC